MALKNQLSRGRTQLTEKSDEMLQTVSDFSTGKEKQGVMKEMGRRKDMYGKMLQITLNLLQLLNSLPHGTLLTKREK